MRKLISFIILAILFGFTLISYGADTKGSALSAPSGGPVRTDKIYVVDDPGGTPISTADTIANILGLMELGDIPSMTLAEFNTKISDAVLLDDGAISDSIAIGLNTGNFYTHFGDIDDNSLNEMFEAIDSGLTNHATALDPHSVYMLDTDINTPAKLESVTNSGTYASDILATTDQANFREITNIDPDDISMAVNDGDDINSGATKYSRFLITQNDDAISGVTLDETSVPNKAERIIVNSGVTPFEMNDVNGIQEIGGTIRLHQYDFVKFMYVTDRWVCMGGSFTEFLFSTLSAYTKTYSVKSGVTNATQLSSIAGDTVTLAVFEVINTDIQSDESGVTVFVLPTTPVLGMGFTIYSGVTAAPIQITHSDTVYVNGEAVAGATGATMVSTGIGDFAVIKSIHDMAAGVIRWAVYTKEF